MRAPRALWALPLLLTACRADVSGRWEGHVGDEAAEMTLDQAGALVTGRLCLGGRCADVDGDLIDSNLELAVGCGPCDLPATLLDLDLRGPDLTGDAQLDPCTCDEDDCCRQHAQFERAR